MDETTALLALMAALATAGPVLALRRRARFGPFHPALAFGVPYCVVTSGPVIRYLAYGTAPYGIKPEMLNGAMLVAVAAQAGILLGCGASGLFRRRPASYVYLRSPARLRPRVGWLCAVALALAASALAARWADLTTVGKLDLGAADSFWSRLHYASFFLVLALVPAVVVADQMVERRAAPILTKAVVGALAVLCLLEGERDVVLALLMIPISWLAVRRDGERHGGRVTRRARWKRWRAVVHGGIAFAAVAGLLAVMQWARGANGLTPSAQLASLREATREESVVQAILGLGSNLFVVSRVIEWVPDELPYEGGMTYVHTLGNLAPSFLLPQLRQGSLLTWFKERYAPTSQSGYGFGMEAEAYLNFGLLGPVVVFAVWTLVLCRLHDGYASLPRALLYRYAYTFFLPFSLYCMRGDSLMCVKGATYSVGLVWLVATLARAVVRVNVRIRRVRWARPLHARPVPVTCRPVARAAVMPAPMRATARRNMAVPAVSP